MWGASPTFVPRPLVPRVQRKLGRAERPVKLKRDRALRCRGDWIGDHDGDFSTLVARTM